MSKEVLDRVHRIRNEVEELEQDKEEKRVAIHVVADNKEQKKKELEEIKAAITVLSEAKQEQEGDSEPEAEISYKDALSIEKDKMLRVEEALSVIQREQHEKTEQHEGIVERVERIKRTQEEETIDPLKRCISEQEDSVNQLLDDIDLSALKKVKAHLKKQFNCSSVQHVRIC